MNKTVMFKGIWQNGNIREYCIKIYKTMQEKKYSVVKHILTKGLCVINIC